MLLTQSDGPLAVLSPGSPAAQSSSRRVAALLLARPALAMFEYTAVELSELRAEALLARDQAAEVDEALATVEPPDLIVMAAMLLSVKRATQGG